MRFLKFTAVGLCLCLFSALQAQILNPNKVKFGKVSEEELTMTSYHLDEDAGAVVLYDKAELSMSFDLVRNSFEYVMERHLRIKVLSSSSVNIGNFSFSLESSSGTAEEEMLNIRGATYNWVDGSVDQVKLSKDAIFREKVTDYFSYLKLAFPQVKEGSIIELKYTKISDFVYRLPVWEFQKEIPVDYSSFKASIPEYFTYNVDMRGFAMESLTENVANKSGRGSVLVQYRSNSSTSGVKTTERVDFNTQEYLWTAVEVPKLKAEPFAPSVHNYFFQVSFELANIQFPGGIINNYSNSWESISKNYRQSSSVKAYLRPRKVVVDLASTWGAGIEERPEKMMHIYEEIKAAVVWDGSFFRYPLETPANLLKVKTGNSADMNYLLLSALTAEGYAAEPVLVSTRNYGLISIASPSLSQFNHVIVLVTLDPDNKILLDATGKDMPGFLLPKHNMNDRGRLMRENSSEWVNLSATATNKSATQLQLNLDQDGKLTGTAKIKEKDYAAIGLRRQVEAENEVKAYLEKETTAVFEGLEINGLNNYYEDIDISSNVDFSDQVIDGGGLFYIPSVLMKQFDENPFKTETRALPIDFIVPQDFIYVTQLDFSDGLVLEEMPESINFALPENRAKYSIQFVDLNGKIQIIEKLTIKQTFYGMDDYLALRKFFDLVLENQEMPLVIKKI